MKAKIEGVNKLVECTGLSYDDCIKLLENTNWTVDEAKDNIELLVTGSGMTMLSKDAIVKSIENAGMYNELAENLSKLNTMRGGEKGFKGFVFEEMHATDATVNGQVTKVINNNGLADFEVTGKNGSKTYAQAKSGYKNTKIDYSKYTDQAVVIDKGNTKQIADAQKAGKEVIESNIYDKDAASLAKRMQTESKITKSQNSVIVPKVNSAINVAKEANSVGIKTAKTGGQFGAGFSIGSNVIDVISGDKEMEEAVVDIAVDTVISTGVGYATGAGLTVLGNTAIGTAATSAASGAIATTAAALSTTTTGAAAVAAGTSAIAAGVSAATAIGSVGTAAVTSTIAAGAAVTGTISAAGAAAAAGASAVGTAVAGTAVGTAVTGAAAAAGTAIASTAVGSAAVATGAAVAAGAATAGAAVTAGAVAAGAVVTAGAIAAAPVVAVGAAIGGAFALGRRLFGR